LLLGIASITAASLVAALMYFNPKLMEHPGRLIFLMCISEAISVWCTLMMSLKIEKIICYFQLDDALLITLGYFVKSQTEAMALLEKSNILI